MKERQYVIISPCRNEAAYMRQTLDSVITQTLPPALWVIVDDGSTDDTPAILAEYAARHSYISIVTRENRGHRSVGPGVIDAFYAGYEMVPKDRFPYLCKLDLDLDLPSRYFEELILRTEADPRLGTCSGKPYFVSPQSGKLVSEGCGDENSVGMTKFYRVDCFKQIGGFVRQVMWDGIDGHRCRMLGWKASSWDEPELRFIHLRPMGSSQKNIVAGRMRHGYGQYFMGTGLIYMTVSALYRMTRQPYMIGGAAMWWGYLRSMVKREPRLDDPRLRSFIRRYQWSCLLRGKARATKRLEAEREPYWRPLPGD